MTVKRIITTEVEMTSGASEAGLITHMDEFISELKSHGENMRHQSWHQSINESWDDSNPVKISVTSTVK